MSSRVLPPGRRRRWRRLLHRVRAARHHASALLREFRGQIAAFVALTVGGGLVYGELYRAARGVAIPLIDRPYVMLQLMLLEAPEAVPPEWYLAVFWYALPVAFLVLLGLGAADFIDLFFNRSGDRDRWGEALAMTYRNHIVLLGAGHVGLRVLRDLVEMGLEVVAVDYGVNPEKREALEELGVPVVAADARNPRTLRTAGVAHADAFVACTGDDHVNLEAVMHAREINPHIRVVSRAWARTFARQMESHMGVQAVLSAADLSAPAFAGAAVGVEITQTLRLGDEEYSTVRLEVMPRSFLAGAEVGTLERDLGMEIVLHRADGRALVDPPPQRVLEAGDEIVVFAPHARVLDVVARNRDGRAPKA